jgi:hypothetical protein
MQLIEISFLSSKKKCSYIDPINQHTNIFLTE